MTVIVALGAGLFLYLDQGKGPKPDSSSQSARTSAAQEAKELLSNSGPQSPDMDTDSYQLSGQDKELLQASAKSWPTRVFWLQKRVQAKTDAAEALIYSGFMQAPKQRLALINGAPFAEGDLLQGIGWPKHRLQSISESRVVIITPNKKRVILARQADGPTEMYKPAPKSTRDGSS